MYSITDADSAQSQNQDDHRVGPLLHYFLAPGCVPVTSDEVIDRVIMENLRDAHSQLQGCQDELRKLKDRLKDLREVLEETRISYDDVKRGQDSTVKEDLKKRKKILRKDIRYCEEEIEKQEYGIRYCEAYLDGAHPSEAKKIASTSGATEDVPEVRQAEADQGMGRDATTSQGQDKPRGSPKAEAAEMETEVQDEPHQSDHESEISTPQSEQSSIKSDEEQIIGMDEVTATTHDMTLDTPRGQEAESHLEHNPGTQDEPQK